LGFGVWGLGFGVGDAWVPCVCGGGGMGEMRCLGAMGEVLAV
jgi:hypothetical protein